MLATEDATYLEFDFQLDPAASQDLYFNFVFASEEYNEFANSLFNDVFAFFIDGRNIAFIPGTTTPISINTINGGNPLGTNPQNPQFYNNNSLVDNGQFLNLLGYDGFTEVFTAQRVGVGPGTHTIKLAISDVFDQDLDSAVFLQLGSFANIQVGTQPQAGDWRGVQLLQNTHDRNVDTAIEWETGNATISGTNDGPAEAQSLGTLAPNEKAADDNRRLGFDVRGAINRPGDLDVYSFQATAGTEVWLDIDRTSHALDTVLELVDEQGLVLARSDNSEQEAENPNLLYRDPTLGRPPRTQSAEQIGFRRARPLDGQSARRRDAGRTAGARRAEQHLSGARAERQQPIGQSERRADDGRVPVAGAAPRIGRSTGLGRPHGRYPLCGQRHRGDRRSRAIRR